MDKLEFKKLYYAEKVNEMFDVLYNIRNIDALNKSDEIYELIEDTEQNLFRLLQILKD